MRIAKSTHKVEALSGNREEEGGDINREDDSVEESRRSVERASEWTESELGRPEAIRCLGETQQADKAIRRDGRDTSSGDERGEGDIAGEDDAEDQCSEDEHDGDSVSGLSVLVDATYPP